MYMNNVEKWCEETENSVEINQGLNTHTHIKMVIEGSRHQGRRIHRHPLNIQKTINML